ncbi:heterogeneous nuclear ribonucleoprotein 1-like [Silene latifolia]|uniref:heterogeneous nuclear ribonucleoprotein 1-like n=1 Tax=Silene latifolia TaxID=37657 RepID=UPI003D77C16B
MDADQGKLFVGGISWETSEEKLKEYFGQYGDVLQANIMRDKTTGRPRGFGFVHFSDPSVLDRVLQDKHSLDGRSIEAKRATSREEQQNTARTGNNGGRNGGGGGNIRTKKIFVGGLPPSLTDEGFRQYFEGFGHVTDVVIMFDQNTQRPRGFGFISFDSEDAVDRVLQSTFHDLDGKQVEVKRALPKDANPGMASRGSGGGSGAGSGNYGYNSSGNQSSYDSRMESNRYMQPQSAGGGFPSYGSSGYGAAGYGYGPASGGMGYGGYPGYGAPTNAAYGNPNVPSAGYGSGPGGAPRSSWNAQMASGYGASGYGNSAGPVGQSPTVASGYGSQGYGYGNYGGAPSSNTSGGAGGELQAGYGSGYADANGHGGYANGAQMGYGGGYGGAQSRQTQQ